ncbi:hypothetical protein FRACYDRAFT_246628 [Fragilariopsis cylindrus CCMP1102]|uniref:Uncharacterized protein n=1 Tax=Fragilariopsis cylindrus CCMP1102 TaxID=635003 RepID=A0A1E7EXS3_9STRA|nr:hypothetical protein FRACYDRAFT_246628 [Fragilariopsis cylindrus CCMP1102]|eukprot:OEU10761.1 hypothetical protein FRACYDRAFT_246628 [Fragilariopsis cylindrus CCMP1102]
MTLLWRGKKRVKKIKKCSLSFTFQVFREKIRIRRLLANIKQACTLFAYRIDKLLQNEIKVDGDAHTQELYASLHTGTAVCNDIETSSLSYTDIETAAVNPASSISERDNLEFSLSNDVDPGVFCYIETMKRCCDLETDLIAKIKEVVTPAARKKDTSIPSNDTPANAAAAATVSFQRSQEEIASCQVEEVATFVRAYLPRALVSTEEHVRNIARSMISLLTSDDRESLGATELLFRSVVDSRGGILLPSTPELEAFIQECERRRTESNQSSRINDNKGNEKIQYTRTSNTRSDKSSEKKGKPKRKTHCCSFCGQPKVTTTKTGLQIPHGTCPKVIGTDVGEPGNNDIDDTFEKNPKRYKVLYPSHPNKAGGKDGSGDGNDGSGQTSATSEALIFWREKIAREELEDDESTKVQTKSLKRKNDNANSELEETHLYTEEVQQQGSS